jgi:hypothetical protein
MFKSLDFNNSGTLFLKDLRPNLSTSIQGIQENIDNMYILIFESIFLMV